VISASADSSARRQSTFPSTSRQSMLPPSGQVTRESRPIKTSSFQAACRENIEQFCRSQRCPIPITDRLLVSPTQKDFHQIFRWLISEFIDPNYPWGKPQTDKTQIDDVLAVLGDLRYSAIGNISKTALTAPGSAANWGTLLAMLNWLVDLAKVSPRLTLAN
jgi:kinetochore protein NDC80